MLGPMLILAGLCIAIGLLPAAGAAPGPADSGRLAIVPGGGAMADTAWNADAMGVTVLGVGLLAPIVLLLLGAAGYRPAGGAAGPDLGLCRGSPTSRMQYTASSYAALLLGAFGPLAGHRTSAGPPTASHTSAADPVQDGAVLPAWRMLGRPACASAGFRAAGFAGISSR